MRTLSLFKQGILLFVFLFFSFGRPMVPCNNPDGMYLVLENYKKYVGTQYEGVSLPQVYHRYAGHDNNRDFVSHTQEDPRAIARICNLDWFPQVMVEKHQMGSTGIRYFVPPAHDPIAENVDGELGSWMGVIGTNMLRDLAGAGLTRVGQKTIFDMYWPGSTETCTWKNVIGILAEAASVREASRVYIEPDELQARREGLNIPGSLVRLGLKKDQPLTLGMPASAGVFYRGNPLFTTSFPRFDMERSVIGHFPEKNFLLSGYSEKEELLAGQPAMLWVRKGTGCILLFQSSVQGINPGGIQASLQRTLPPCGGMISGEQLNAKHLEDRCSPGVQVASRHRGVDSFTVPKCDLSLGIIKISVP